jgi:outer membrane protein assembly factor BamB
MWVLVLASTFVASMLTSGPARASQPRTPMPADTALTPGKGVATSDWPQFHRSIDRVGLNPAETKLDRANVGLLSLKWKLATGDFITSSPAVVHGVVYFGSADDKVRAVDAATGATIWARSTSGPVLSSPAVVSGVVYVGSNDAKLYALNASDGSIRWSYTMGGPPEDSSPLVVNGIVYIGNHDGYFYAVNAATGTLRWKYRTWDVWESAAYANGTVYVGSDQYTLFAFDATTGVVKWTATTDGRIRCTPSVSNGVVYVGADDYRTYAFDAATGALRWKSDVLPNLGIVRSTPAIAYGMVYVDTGETEPMGGHTWALAQDTGEVVWSTEMGDYATSSPAVANGVVYTGSFDFTIYAFDASTGEKLWNSSLTTMKDGIESSIAVADGSLYVGSLDGTLYAFTLAQGAPVANYVAIGDTSFNPTEVISHPLGSAVMWTNGGSKSHSVNDSSPLNLFRSGAVAAGAQWQYTFIAASVYDYACAKNGSFAGKVKVPMVLEPTTGDVRTTFTITWASAPPPPGLVYQVQIMQPGAADWTMWKPNATTTDATYVPDAGTGTYWFRANIWDPVNRIGTNYSSKLSITVS